MSYQYLHSKAPILVTGGDGLLGFELTHFLRQKIGHGQVISLNRLLLDITKPEKVREVVEECRPKLIINAAGYTKVDDAEREKDMASAANVDGPKTLARVAQEIGAMMIHFSTDQVFDGTGNVPLTEEDTPNPINYYGLTKLKGEEYVLRYRESIVLRVQWIYGRVKNRFATLKRQSTFQTFNDRFGAPIWTRDISEIVWALIEKPTFGLFHVAYDDYASFTEIYDFIKEEAKLSVKLTPIATEEAHLVARRPKFTVLSNAKLKDTLGVKKIGSWQNSLRHFIKENF